MNVRTHMSPWTALFLGLFALGAVTISSASALILYGMRIIDGRAGGVLTFAADTVSGLPQLIDAMPPGVDDLLSLRRDPSYAANVSAKATLVSGDRSGRLRPVLEITNRGDSVISLLVVRVAAMDEHNIPVGEWTEVVATPVAVEGPWRGPIMPHATRNVVMHGGWRVFADDTNATLRPAVEISDVFVWRPAERIASAGSG